MSLLVYNLMRTMLAGRTAATAARRAPGTAAAEAAP
jgi:hypothetical protein